jgi:hypothetical protein
MKYSFTMSFSDVEKGAVLTGKRSATIKQDIHKMNVSILQAWFTSGDVSHAARTAGILLANVDGYYGQAIVNWFKMFAGFDYDPKNKEQPFSYTATKITVDEVKAAKLKTFEQVTPPPQPKAFKFIEELQKVLSKAAKHLEKPVEGDAVDPEAYRKAQALLAQLQAEG